MKNYFFLLALLFCVKSYTQTTPTSVPPYIEVIGSAEIAVKPDVYFINLQIFSEAYDGISFKEKSIGNELIKAGIKSTDFSLTALSYDYPKQNMQMNGRIQYRNYILHIQTEKQITDVFNALIEAGVEQSFVTGVDYTKKAAIINKLRIEAMRNASEKATSTVGTTNRAIAKILSIVEEFSGPQLFNDTFPSPYSNTLQQQNNSYIYDRAALQRNYESIQFKVCYRVKYSVF